MDALSSCVGAETFGLCSKEWPLLQAFSAPFTRPNQTAASALIPVEWPHLRQLNFVATDDAMPSLLKSKWPQRRIVTIAGNLHGGGLETSVQLPLKYIIALTIQY